LGQGSTFTLRLPTLDVDHHNESNQEES